MQEQYEHAEFKLDALTRSVRFAAGIAPKAANRVSLGVALALEDSLLDPAGELLGVKVAQGFSGIASTVGVIGHAAGAKTAAVLSSAKGTARSVSRRVGTSGSALRKAPVLGAAARFVSQAAGEFKESWDACGYVAVEVVAEQPAPAEQVMSARSDAEPSL